MTEETNTVSARDTYAGFAPYYDALTQGFNKDVPLYLELAKGAKPPFLEVGIGTGRLVPYLIESMGQQTDQGVAMVGVDIADEMLKICRSKYKDAIDGGRLVVANHDFIQFPLREQFDLTMVTWFTFNYIPEADREMFLHHVHESLNPRGILTLDLFYPDSLRHPERAEQWIDAKNPINMGKKQIALREYRSMITDTQEKRIQIFSELDGAQHIVTTVRNYVSPQAVKGLLEQAGFHNIRRTHKYQFPPTYDFEPILAEKNFVIIAEK